MECFQWSQLIWPAIAGFVLAIFVHYTKDYMQRLVVLPTAGYTIILCVVVGVGVGLLSGWTWPAMLFLWPALAFLGSQLFHLVGRGLAA